MLRQDIIINSIQLLQFLIQITTDMYEEHLYKQQLFNTMGKDDELVDTVKLHLRQKIINKLKSNKEADTPQTDQSLIKKICVSLFLDYLNTHRYFHTLSVFAPEANSSKSQFTNEQLKSLFRIQTHNYDTILQSVLHQVMPKGRLHEKKTDSYAQTDDKECIQNLQNKLSHIQFQYKQKMSMGLKNVEETEQRFLKYKNELNKRYKQELQSQLDRIRTYEIANIRMEEQEKYKLKIKQYQQQLQISYKNKMDKLRDREAEVIQRVANKMKEVETYNYQARQRMLRDLESIKAREEELQRMKAVLEAKQIKMNSK